MARLIIISMRVERFELSATAWKAVNLTINRYPLFGI